MFMTDYLNPDTDGMAIGWNEVLIFSTDPLVVDLDRIKTGGIGSRIAMMMFH